MKSFGFRSLHPAVLVLYYAGGMTFGMLLFHPATLLAGLLSSAAVHLALDRGEELCRWAKPLLLGALALALLNPLLVRQGATVLFYLGQLPVTKEAAVYGLTMAAAVLNLLVMAVSWRIVVSGQAFLYLFARVSPKGALLAMMAIGLVPRLRRRLGELMLVQQTRGVTVSAGSFRARAANGVRLVQSLLAWSLEDALQTADSMQARGYGLGPRSSYMHVRLRRRDLVSGVFLLAAAMAMFGCWLDGYGLLRVYPRFAEFAMRPGDWAAVGAYGGFVAWPLVWEWRDRRKWRIWKREG